MAIFHYTVKIVGRSKGKDVYKRQPYFLSLCRSNHIFILRIGETCGLTWQDINLEDQCLTIKRSIRYDGTKHKNIIGPTKRKKVRIVDFGNTLTELLKTARKEQLKSRMQYGELYHRNFYKEAQDKNRVYYEYYHLDGTEEIPVDYKEISFVCLRPDGCLELPSTLSIACRSVAKRLDGFENFHFHQLRHTYTSNLLSNGAAPKDVQELLGHSDVCLLYTSRCV